jgi:hypothetical protein
LSWNCSGKHERNPNDPNGLFDNLVKSWKAPFSVIPAEAGIQVFQYVLDPGFRRGDASSDFLRVHLVWDLENWNLFGI